MSRGGKRKNAGRKKLKEPRNIYKRLTVKENELIEEMRNNPNSNHTSNQRGRVEV